MTPPPSNSGSLGIVAEIAKRMREWAAKAPTARLPPVPVPVEKTASLVRYHLKNRGGIVVDRFVSRADAYREYLRLGRPHYLYLVDLVNADEPLTERGGVVYPVISASQSGPVVPVSPSAPWTGDPGIPGQLEKYQRDAGYEPSWLDEDEEKEEEDDD
jgi:hypothetical protein